MAKQPGRKPGSEEARGKVFGDRTARLGPRRPPPPRRQAPWIQRNRGPLLGAIGLVVVVAAAIIFALKATSSGSSHPAAATQQAAPNLTTAVTHIPTAVYDSVGSGSVDTSAWKPISAPALQSGGKPEILYVGGEFCPFCAAERWSLIAALSRFGSFSNLSTTRSSANDVFPSTATFTFSGSSYSSQYLVFTPVEEFSNQRSPSGGYTILQPLTSDQQTIVKTYDAPPYLPTAGAIPFVDFGGKYALQGATYSPAVLSGQDWSQIAAKLSQASSDVAKGIVGSANLLTAAICSLTNQQPANVCQAPGTQQAGSKLGGH